MFDHFLQRRLFFTSNCDSMFGSKSRRTKRAQHLRYDVCEPRLLLSNVPPTLDPLSDLIINADSLQQVIDLNGITAGEGEEQDLRVTATSNNVGLIPNPLPNYTSPETNGSLAFTPVSNRQGNATITVTVEDGGLDNDLTTADDNSTFSRDFAVTVNPIQSQFLTSIFWSDGNTLFRSYANGSGQQTLFTLEGASEDHLIKFDIDPIGKKLFVAYSTGHNPIQLYSADLDGGSLQLVNNSDSMGSILQAVGLNSQNGDIYVSPHHLQPYTPGAAPGGMLRLTDGGSTITTFSQRPYYVQDIDVSESDGFVYYSRSPGSNDVRRMNLDGSGDIQLFGGLSGYPRIAVDTANSSLYYPQGLADLSADNIGN